MSIRDLFEEFPELANAKVQFWTCLNPEHKTVTWNGDVASCDTCGLTSEMVRKFAKAVQAHERERCVRLAEKHAIRYSKPVPCNCGGDRCPGQADEWFDFADLLRGTDG